MATLAASSVTILKSWSEGGPAGKNRACRQVSIVTDGSPGNGDATNNIPAAVLQLAEIEEATQFLNVTNTKLLEALPDATGANLLLFDVEQATDANRGNPANFISKTIRGIVKGRPR